MTKQLIALASVSAAAFAGPKTPVAEFFANHVDTSVPALAPIPTLMEKGDVAGAEKVFADHVRATLQADKVNVEWLERKYTPAALSNLTARAAAVMDYTLESCGTPYHFPDRKVDWEFNPTPNQYREWVYQLSRHWCWSILAEYYLATGDEKAVTTWLEMADGWLNQEIVPEKGVGAHATKCWRTIDAGIRVKNWTRQFAAFAKSPQVTDAFIASFFASIWEHGWRLRNNTTNGNWLLTELRGILTVSVLYPFLKDAPEWRNFALKRLESEFSRQVYPDGFQYELTTAYHGVSINEYLGLFKLYAGLGLDPPPFIHDGLERMYDVYPRLSTPNRRTPDLNDGEEAYVIGRCQEAAQLIPARDDFRWFATLGKEGIPPDYLSYAFPNAGAVLFRDSWKFDAVWAYFDASPFGHAHQHEDKLNFLLQAYGRDMLVEGGNYFYDSSEIRKYALSTRAHNTIRIDRHDQAQRRTYRWLDADIKKKANLEFETTPGRDRARASYTAGYGPGLIKAVHDRTVLFLKDVVGCSPFFVVVDRLTPPADEKTHKYEILWHLDSCALAITNATFTGDFGKGVGLFAATSATNAVLTDKKGQTKPELQGWMPLWISAPHEDKPIPTVAVEGTFDTPLRIVTVFYPYRENKCPVRDVHASADLAATDITLVLADGTERTLGRRGHSSKWGVGGVRVSPENSKITAHQMLPPCGPRSPRHLRTCDASHELCRVRFCAAARLDLANQIADRRPGAQAQFCRSSPFCQPATAH